MKHRSGTCRGIVSCLFICLCLCSYLTSVQAVDGFVTLTEYTSDGKEISWPANHLRNEVDINSYVSVHFHPEVLAPYCQETTFSRGEQLDTVAALEKFLSTSRVQWSTFVQRMDTLYEELQAHPTPALEREFRQQLAQQGTLMNDLLDLLEPVVGSERLNAALDTPDPLYRELFNLLSEHITHVQGQLKEETMRMIQQSQQVVRVWCIHESAGSTPAAVHLNHYDTLEAGTLQRVDKVSFTPEDGQRLQASVDFYQNLVTMTKELNQYNENLLDLFTELTDQFRTGLETLQEPLQLEKLEQAWTALQDELLTPSSSTVGSEIAEKVRQMAITYQQISAVHQRYQELLQSVSKVKQANPLVAYPGLMQALDRFQRQLFTVLDSRLPETFMEEVEGLQAALTQVGSVLPMAVHEKAATLAQITKTWATEFTSKVTREETRALYSDLLAALQGLSGRLSYTDVMAKLPVDNTVPEAAQKVALGEIQPTSIDIPRTQRKEGDTFTLYVQVDKGELPLMREEYTIRVQTYGVYSTWKSGLLFVKCAGDEIFQPTSGLSWVLHYRPRRDKDWFASLLDDPISPGIGLNSVMFFDKTQIQYGLGITVTFFDDLIQMGYGIHLQRTEEEGRNYVFVGASLLDLLQPSSGARASR